MESKVAIILLVHFLLFTACQNPNPKTAMVLEKNYKEGFVESGKVKLHYLDWGGKGKVLSLIPGLGDTPFIFDGLAKKLSQNFRVISYSRRNHGKSASSDNKFDNETLVADLKLLLDSLKIDGANLLGWSMGGNEITAFASHYPGRVDKLIYFEAGYDLSDGGFAKIVNTIPRSYLPDENVMKSLDSYRNWYHRFWFGDVHWNNALEENLLASVGFYNDSSVAPIPDDDVFKAILSEAMNYRREYNKIQCPCLVIYAKPFFHPADRDPATVKTYDSIENNIISPWRTANRQRIEAELQHATIVDAPKGTHTSFLFLSPDYLAETITKFILRKRA